MLCFRWLLRVRLGGHETEFALMLGFRELSPSGQAFVRIAENTDI